MRALGFAFRLVLAIVRLALGITIAVARVVTVCLLWFLAPRACVAFTLLRRR